MSKPMAVSFSEVLGKRRGAGMTEYLILVGVLAIVAIIAFKVFGQSVSSGIHPRDPAAGVEK
jgi:Flp pilus assembly pilin Flp